MTASDDFIPVEEFEEQRPTYPVAFGIELTPRVQGIAIGIVGIALGAYLFNQFIQPVRERNQSLRVSILEKQEQLANQQQQLQEIAEVRAALDEAVQERKDIYSLFATEETMDTLLLDLNQRVKDTNTGIRNTRNRIQALRVTPELIEARLQRFTPAPGGVQVIQDASYGAGVDGKLQREVFSVGFQGSFEQTQAIIRNIERLEPLIILRDFQTTRSGEVAETVLTSEGRVVLRPKPLLDTSFQLEALIPTANPDELPQPAAAPAEGEQPAAAN